MALKLAGVLNGYTRGSKDANGRVTVGVIIDGVAAYGVDHDLGPVGEEVVIDVRASATADGKVMLMASGGAQSFADAVANARTAEEKEKARAAYAQRQLAAQPQP
jgi:carbon monoxide dehydrogenase subunit G